MIDLNLINLVSANLLHQIIVGPNGNEVMGRISSKYNPTQLSKGGGAFLAELVTTQNKDEIIDKFPTIDFAKLGAGEYQFWFTLFTSDWFRRDPSRFSILIDKMTDKIDPSVFSEFGELLYQKLFSLYDSELIPRLDFSHGTKNFSRVYLKDSQQLSYEDKGLLLSLIPIGGLSLDNFNEAELRIMEQLLVSHKHELLKKIPRTIQFSHTSDYAFSFLSQLVERVGVDVLLSHLPSEIDLSDLANSAATFLVRLVVQGGRLEQNGRLMKKLMNHLVLPSKIDNTNVSSGGGKVLQFFVSSFGQDKLFSLIPERLDLNHLSSGLGYFYVACLNNGLEKVLQALPPKVDLSQLDVGGLELLSKLTQFHGQQQQVLKLIPTDYHISEINDNGSSLLSLLIDYGYDHILIEKLLAEDNWNTLSMGVGQLITKLYFQTNDNRLKELL